MSTLSKVIDSWYVHQRAEGDDDDDDGYDYAPAASTDGDDGDDDDDGGYDYAPAA
ncbi:hypothetical protein CRG98_033373 [Punica granatum]|uniref:Uncharacterized protein n=1 Tax=Punica granatum TaxID=22663 RepID=A0A2I0IS24_PUNGR|nr:hypothetical protein CRG98_033373 [Punica granatum]